MKRRVQVSLRRRLSRLLLLLLLVALVFQSLTGVLTTSPPPVEAGGFASLIISIAGIGNAFKARNAVYKENNRYIAQQKEYYARLHAKLKEQLVDREIVGLRESQVAAYTKVWAMIEQEKETTIGLAESEKKAARAEFKDKFGKILIFRAVSSGGAQRLVRVLTGSVRAAQGKIDEALVELAGGGGGALAKLGEIRRKLARIQQLSSVFGGPGQQLSRLSGRLGGAIDRATGTFEVPLAQVREEIGQIGDAFESLDMSKMEARIAENPREFGMNFVDGEAQDPVGEAILSLFGPVERGDSTVRQRARQKLLEGFVLRCAVMSQQLQEATDELERDLTSEEATADSEDAELSLCGLLADAMEEEPEGEERTETESTEEEAAEEEPAESAPIFGTGSVRLAGYEATPMDCSQEQSGHTFYVTCWFTVDYEVEYVVPEVPAYLHCAYYWDDIRTTELKEPSGIGSGQLTTFEITSIYRDENIDGAVDEPMSPDEDGRYLDLWCALSPKEESAFVTLEEHQYAVLRCYRPIHEDHDPEVCTAPFLPYYDTHK